MRRVPYITEEDDDSNLIESVRAEFEKQIEKMQCDFANSKLTIATKETEIFDLESALESLLENLLETTLENMVGNDFGRRMLERT